jgi:polyhydroxyalkanoate synthase
MMDNKDNSTTPLKFFEAMNAETVKLVEMFAGKSGLEHLKPFNDVWSALLSKPVKDPQHWLQAVTDYQRSHMQLWSNFLTGSKQSGVQPAPSDRRFSGEQWTEHPIFNYIKESYLIASRMMNQMVSGADMDEKSKSRLKFATQQYIDALSPTNFAVTNPEVLQQAMETGGQSLVDGLKNLMGDLEKGRISMTDEEAFEVGKNLAITEGAVVFENDLFQLIEYKPETETVHGRPLLIVPPCINKFYVLDLQPHNSFVKYSVEQGQRTFMISWKNPTPGTRHINWDDYVEKGVLTAVDVVRKISGSPNVNAVSWCVGGTILATVLAVMAARADESISSATFLTTMTDFSEPGDIGVFLDENNLSMISNEVEKKGVFEGRNMATTFNMLRSNDLIWSYVVNNYLKGQAPAPFDILYWNSDSTNLPAAMYTYYIKNMYAENNLVKPGCLTICGEKIDLTRVKTPSYFLSTIEDHIAPWKSTFRTTEFFTGPMEFVLAASGHIAGVINPVTKDRRHYWIDGELGKGADRWLETASQQPGSWWKHWSGWIKRRGGDQIEAPRSYGNAEFREIEPAPGRYVKERIS